MSDDSPGIPEGWADAELMRYLSMAAHNRHVTFLKCRDSVDKLIAIDDVFMKLANWENPPDRLTPLLAIRCHAAFRAAAEHAMAGQLGDLFPNSRAALENAAYAVMLHRDVEKAEIWLKRHDDEEAKRRSRQTFQHVKVLAAVRAQSEVIGQLFGDLYEETIDFGGHPNERGLSVNARMWRGADGNLRIEQTMLQSDPSRVLFGLRAVREVGMCALAMIHFIAPERLGSDGVELQEVAPELLAARSARIWGNAGTESHRPR